MNPGRRCTKCGAEIQRDDHFCPRCGAGQDGTVAAPHSLSAAPLGVASRLQVLPRGISTRVEGDALVIAWRWYHAGYVVGVVFALAIMGFFGWLTWHDHHDPTSNGTITSFLGLFVWPATLGLLYWMFAGIYNTTFITAYPKRIEVAHRPIWWPGRKVMAADNLAELETVRQLHKVGIWQGSVDFAIAVRTVDKRRWWLGGTIRTPDVADFIAEAVGAFYGVPVKTFREKMRQSQLAAAAKRGEQG